MSERIAETAKAKVNLALHVLGRRADGYHDIDSIVAFAGVADRLLVTLVAGASTPVTLTVSGPFSTGVPTDESNLICRAYRFLSEHVVVPAVAVHLEKNLPVAAGIGGGSADAAAALRAFVRLSSATLPERTLHDIALALGELTFVRVEEERDMGEFWHRPTKGFVKKDVFGRAREPLFGADDVRDLHQMIIHDIGQMVSRVPVGFHQHLVVDVASIDLYRAAHEIVKYDIAPLGRDIEADHKGFTVFQFLFAFVGCEREAVFVILRCLLVAGLLFAYFGQTLGSAKTVISLASGNQFIGVFFVERQAL